MSAIQVKKLLNVACKVVDNTCTFLRGEQWPLSFTSTMSFKVFDQLGNLIPIWKYVEIELSSVSGLNNGENLTSVWKCAEIELSSVSWLNHGENLTPIWKCVEIELSSVSWLNHGENLTPVRKSAEIELSSVSWLNNGENLTPVWKCAEIKLSSVSWLNHGENLTPVWKCAEIELSSVSWLNNLERLFSVLCLLTKDLPLHHSQHNFAIFDYLYQNLNYFLVIIRKEKENKVNREDLKSYCFVSIILKHPVVM